MNRPCFGKQGCKANTNDGVCGHWASYFSSPQRRCRPDHLDVMLAVNCRLFLQLNVSLFVSGVWGCRARNVLVTRAAPRPPVRPQRSGGSGMERTEVPVSAPRPGGAPRWRRSSNWEGCQTLWAALLSPSLSIQYNTRSVSVFACSVFFILLFESFILQEEQDIRALQAKNRKLGEALDQRQVQK